MAYDGDSMLSEDEKAEILASRNELQRMRHQATDTQQLKDAMKQLEKVSASYVARRMNASVQKTMAGHKVEEFNND